MATDYGALARLFQINFAPSFHYQQPNPYNIRTGTDVYPIAQTPGVRSNVSFLTGLDKIISYGGAIAATIPAITSAVYGRPTAGGAGAVAKVPATVAPPTTPSGIVKTAIAHPIQSIGTALVAGTGAVGLGMGLTHLLGGAGHGRYGSPGERGYHMIKKGPHAGQWVRNRRRNVGNIRALRRALSRAHGFERICRKVMHFTHPGRARGRAVFRRRRRSK